jgi:hypothetical protein
MAMNTDDCLRDIVHLFEHAFDKRTEFCRHGITDGIRNIDRTGPSGDDGLQNLIDVFGVSAAGVHTGEFYIAAVLPGVRHRAAGHLEDFLATLFQLIKQVHIRRGEDDVNTRVSGVFDSLPAFIDSFIAQTEDWRIS